MRGEEWREASPVGLQRNGEEFITVARDALAAYRKRLTELSNPQVPQYRKDQLLETAPFPIYYNFLHGVELGLKSYLLHVKAATLEGLRKRFGHKLDCLLGEALQHNLRSQCRELTDTHIGAIDNSSWLCEDKQFEYHRTGGVSPVPIDCVAEAAETLIAALKRLRMKPSPAG